MSSDEQTYEEKYTVSSKQKQQLKEQKDSNRIEREIPNNSLQASCPEQKLQTQPENQRVIREDKGEQLKKQETTQKVKMQSVAMESKECKKQNESNDKQLQDNTGQNLPEEREQDLERKQSTVHSDLHTSNKSNVGSESNEETIKEMEQEMRRHGQKGFDYGEVIMPDKEPIDNQKNQVAEKQPNNQEQIKIEDIIREAQRQRISYTYQKFMEYLNNYEKNIRNHKNVVQNIHTSLKCKKQSKTKLVNLLKQYYNQYVQIGKEMHEKSYKYVREEKTLSKNKFINIQEDLKAGMQELVFMRKAIGNDFHRLQEYIINHTNKHLAEAFDTYLLALEKPNKKIQELRENLEDKSKELKKKTAKLEKIYKKGQEGFMEEDIFVEMVKFIKLQKQQQAILIALCKNVPEVVNNFIKADDELFQEIQRILNDYKAQAAKMYVFGQKEFNEIVSLHESISSHFHLSKLCNIVDLDYIKYVYQMHHKKDLKQMTDACFHSFFNLQHLATMFGSSQALLSGICSKRFAMSINTQELVNTICGNLVLYDSSKLECIDRLIIKNCSAKLIGGNVIEIEQIQKGVIFDSTRKLKLSMNKTDTAEELLYCFCQEKQTQTIDQ